MSSSGAIFSLQFLIFSSMSFLLREFLILLDIILSSSVAIFSNISILCRDAGIGIFLLLSSLEVEIGLFFCG